jgi:hypothetical protein
MYVSSGLRDLVFANGWRQDPFNNERGQSKDSAEHYSSIPITQLVAILDTAKAKPERDIPERSSNDDARQPFQFAHRLTPLSYSDGKIRGGLQQIHSRAVVHCTEVWQKF